MVLELGPSPAEEALNWIKFARRILVELRTEAGVGDELLDLWSQTIEEWSSHARHSLDQGEPFRLAVETEPEVAEFLLNGLDRYINSPELKRQCTPAELDQHRAFTTVVVQSFLDGLTAECGSCQQYADHITESLASVLQA
jgi:hypothetical protein